MFGSTVLSVLFLSQESYGAGVFHSRPNPYRGIPVNSLTPKSVLAGERKTPARKAAVSPSSGMVLKDKNTALPGASLQGVG